MSYNSLYGLRVVKGVKHARKWLEMSLSELGAKLGVDHSTVATWQSGYRDMPSDKGDQLGQLIIDRLAEKLGRDNIRLCVVTYNPFQFVIESRCHCGKWFKLLRSNTRRCEKCRAASKR